jgi:GNAT superfamily N-acetyltransferase
LIADGSDIATLIQPRSSATRVRLATSADEAFLRHLFKTSRAGEFAAAALPPAALDALLEQQFRAQAQGYTAQFPHAVALIVTHDAKPVGRLILWARKSNWRIVDILLLPEARGQGVGADILEATARAARDAGATELKLSVTTGNAAARRLYARLGFKEQDSGVHIGMSRRLVG